MHRDSPISGTLLVLAEVVGLAVESIGEAQVLRASGKQREALNALTGLEGQLQEAAHYIERSRP